MNPQTDRVKEAFNAIKQQFALMKNGVVSDTLAAMKLPHRIIWGLNLPQLKEIAAGVEPSAELAMMLRGDKGTRESVLIAPMVMPREQVDFRGGMEWVDDAPTAEAIDIRVHTLLRHLPFAPELMEQLAASEAPMRRYAAMRLLAGMVRSDVNRARELAEAELASGEPLTRIPARNILDDIEWI
ncbi:MAG: hypothetical protein NC187_10005 [Candidatus Amulumruptor caecigallinarius]|nr:hypothetical protein [Candidatus Amulumruptor caecigallinarius]MCM1397799.1 hypothetical protein [Candidatus Amulumruptor caecigallinarius]MCM1454847.1 hypothetical protein [bacterium]